MPPTDPRPTIRSRAAAAARAAADGTKKSAASPSGRGGTSVLADGDVLKPKAPQSPPPPGPGASGVGSAPTRSGRSTIARSESGTTRDAAYATTTNMSAAGGVQFPRGLADAQRQLYVSLRDELDSFTTHPVLPRSTVAMAKTVFESYVLEQWAAGIGLASTGLAAQHVEQVFADIGVAVTPNDVRDLIFERSPGPDVAFHNAKVAALAQAAQQSAAAAHDGLATSVMTAGGVTGGVRTPAAASTPAHRDTPPVSGQTTPRPSAAAVRGAAAAGSSAAGDSRSSAGTHATTAAATAALKSQSESALSISFEAFVDLLSATLGDCAYRDEMALLWHHLDADGDDVLSAADLRAALRELSATGDELGAPPAHVDTLRLSDQRLRELLDELDVDDDGAVTKRDFLSATNAN